MAGRFEAEIRGFMQKYKNRVIHVVRASAQDVVREVLRPVRAGGHMRVDTGFLRASLMASTSHMPAINPAARPPSGAAPNSYPERYGDIAMVISGAQLGETIYLGFTASYAGVREYYDGFVRLTAQRWPEIVSKNVERALRSLP